MNINKLTDGDRLIRPDEVAELLALSRRTLRRYEIAGRLHPIKINRRVTRYRITEVRTLMELPV